MPTYNVTIGEKEIEALPGRVGVNHWAVRVGRYWYEVDVGSKKTNTTETESITQLTRGACLVAEPAKCNPRYVFIYLEFGMSNNSIKLILLE